MKKKIFGIILPMIAILLTIASLSATYGWYTNTTRIGKIDAETKDLAFGYIFNDDSSTENTQEYSIDNLAFFDIDEAANERKYIAIMATSIKIFIENYSSDEIDYSISFASEKKSTGSTGSETSIAYVAGFFSQYQISDDEWKTDLEDFLSTNDKTIASADGGTLAGTTGSQANATATVYLYLIGIQEIDTAENDFLDESYNFKITLRGSGSSIPTVEEVPTTTPTQN